MPRTARRRGVSSGRDFDDFTRIADMAYDSIVVGLGAMGSATLPSWPRAAAVLGLDRFRPPHALGSSHG